jgi:hypothetical protein
MQQATHPRCVVREAGVGTVIDRTAKRDKRDAKRKKRWPIHGKSLEHVMNGEQKRIEKVKNATN